MSATLTTKRRCPYCGASMQLGDCCTVATSFDDMEYLGAEGFDPSEIRLRSGVEPRGFLRKTKWPVLAPSPRERERRAVPTGRRPRLEEVFGGGTATLQAEGDLPPLIHDGIAREDVPARACPACEFPLPQSIDRREAVVIGMVGVNRVGKTHLLTACLTQAHRQRGLDMLGCTEFVPDDATNGRFREHYFVPLFREQRVLPYTPPEDEDVRFRPFVFDVTLPGIDPFSLVIHDIAGEVLGDHRRRERLATYLRGARGLIFVVDPRDIDGLRDGLPDWMLASNELGSADQGALLAACVRPGGILVPDRDTYSNGHGAGRRLPPVAVTVAKADLLEMACAEPLGFLAEAPRPETRAEFEARIRSKSPQVEAFLERYGAHNILGPAREYDNRLMSSPDSLGARVTYHAVSALGSPPDAGEQLTGRVHPVNCLDPLATILAQITMA
jgi:hypothetical protein